ncbi:TonB-dependent siderophore receptor [Hymenobacter sp. HD11105]
MTTLLAPAIGHGQHNLTASIAPVSVGTPDDSEKNRGFVTGKVTTADGQPVEQAGVLVKNSTMGTSTNADGRFRLPLPAGSYTLVVSYLGVGRQEIDVVLAADQTINLPPIMLAQSAQQLAEVTVTATRTVNDQPVSVGKMAIRPLDLPQSVVTINKEVIEQQQILRVGEILQNVSGVYVMGNTGGTQEEIAGRGFAFNSNNTFKNGVRYNNGVMPEVSGLERFEILKGSSAILYGNVAAGGVINLVTKKPQFQSGGQIGMRVGSYSFYKPTLDVYGAINNSEHVAFRLNTSYENSQSFRDGVTGERFYVNPSVLVKVGSKTDLLLEGDYLKDNRTPDYGIGAINYEIANVPRSRFLNTDWANNETTQKSATLTLTHHLTQNWQVRTTAGYQLYDNNLLSAARPTGIRANGNLLRNTLQSSAKEGYILGQVDLMGKFNTGAINHNLLVGVDGDQYNSRSTSYVAAAYDSINIYDPNKVLAQPRVRADITNLTRNQLTKGGTRRGGIYAQDLISISEKLKVLAGLRWTYQETPSDVLTYRTDVTTKTRRFDEAFSPRLGIVYQPIKTMSVFSSYSNSFNTNSGLDVTGTALPPSILDQYEVGIKNDLFQGVLSANVTAYQIVNSNLAQTVQPGAPNFNKDLPTAQELAGEVTSRGVEVDVLSKPYQGWSFIAGYSYNQTKYTKSNIFEVGSLLRYNPNHTANFSVFYTFGGDTFLKGLNAGFMTSYIGERQAGRSTRRTVENDAFRLIPLEAYTLFDLSVGYTIDRVSLRLKASNLLDVYNFNAHDDNSINPIMPRQFSGTLAYRLF